MDAHNWRGHPAHEKRVGGANQLAPIYINLILPGQD